MQEAVQYYQKALTYNVQYADAYYNLGVAYGEMGSYDKGAYFFVLLLSSFFFDADGCAANMVPVTLPTSSGHLL